MVSHLTETGGPGRSPARALFAALFQVYLLSALFVGVGFVIASALIREAGGNEIVLDVVRDLGIGLLVSVFVVVFIEWRAGLTLRKEIATDVLEAVYRKTVPPPIFDQIRDSTFRSDVLRCDWKLDIAVLDVAEHEQLYSRVRGAPGGENIYLMESTVSYRLKNLNDHSIGYLVSHGIDLDIRVPGEGVPCFTEVNIGKDRFSIDQDQRRSLIDGGACMHAGLSLELDGESEVLFARQAQLPRSGDVDIRYKLLRAIRAPGLYVLSCATPADGISIKIDGPENLAFTVRPLHPQGPEIKEENPGHWEFQFGMLPWQGVQVVSNPVAKSS